MKKVFTLLALALSIAGIQPSALFAALPEKKPTEVSLIALGRLPGHVKLQEGRKDLNVELVTGTRTGAYHYAGTSPLVFFTEKKDAEGRTVRVILATVTYPADWTHVVVFLSATGATTGEPLRGLAIDDSPGGFPPGQMKLFNFYPTALAASSGDASPVQVPPGEFKLVPLTANSKGRTWIRMAVQKGNQWKALPPFVTEIEPGMRALALAYEQGGEAARTVIFDIVPPAPEAKPGPGLTLAQSGNR